MDTHREPQSLYEPCRYFMNMGGKRIRPVLTQIGCGLCGGNLQESLPAALSVELVHNFTLIHDDMMDGAETRRGEMTVHNRWGDATAILAGDLLFTDALEMLNAYDAKRRAILNRRLLRSIRRVCEGQARDLELETREEATVDDYFEMIRGKTAALISAALEMGGIVAGGNKRERSALETIGEIIGVSFQIQDDLLDVTADPEQFGKRKGGDIYEKKRTYLLLSAYARGSDSCKTTLDRIYSKPELDGSDVDQVIQIFHSTGAVERAGNEVRRGYENVQEELKIFGDSRYKRDLVTLVERLTDRES
ncbi:MAG: polyprenyl synthetase family protein [Balneolaceae bacterium]